MPGPIAFGRGRCQKSSSNFIQICPSLLLLAPFEVLGHIAIFLLGRPFLVQFHEYGTNQPNGRLSVRKDPNGPLSPTNSRRDLLEKVEQLHPNTPFPTRFTRKSRAIPSKHALPEAIYSKKSSNSVQTRPSRGDLLEKVEQLHPNTPFPSRFTRESRATPSKHALPDAIYSKKSSNSKRTRPSIAISARRSLQRQLAFAHTRSGKTVSTTR